MANIQISKLDCIVLSDCISTTGKYYCFYGQHLVDGFPCYDVAAMARTGEHQGVAIRRHFNDPSLSPEMNKANAMTYWEEFQGKMTAPRKNDLGDEPTGLEDVSKYLN